MRKYSIAVGMISFLLLLLSMEIVLRYSYPLYSSYNTEMWRYATELKTWPEYGQCHIHHPNRTLKLYGVDVHTNSMGFRSDVDYTMAPSATRTRIMVLGDSIAFGWGVKSNETFASRIQTRLGPGFEVINTGVGNYNSECEVEMFEKYKSMRPDIVVLIFLLNDIEDIDYPTGLELAAKKTFTYAFVSDKILNMGYGGNYEKYYRQLYDDDEKYQNMMRSIRHLVELSENSNATFIFVNFPFLVDDYPFSDIDARIKKDIEGSSVIYVPLDHAFNGTKHRYWVSEEDVHPNALANGIMAEYVFEAINSI
jgi:hypothetical protein